MASEEDLFNAVKETLEKEGKLNKIRTEVRNEVMKILKLGRKQAETPKALTIINEVIREYLIWAGYDYSSTIFSSESSLNNVPLTREEMITELNLEEDSTSKDLPILYSLISSIKHKT
uniref:FGFR1 oncogene partner (FOP) N-terminal dimerisation domain-containing protein n=1 Tax=Clastoptera arizonana TaxID=38151 RepID=A0A1B6DMT8_9HEMI